MKKITHIEALVDFAAAVNSQDSNSSPIKALANYLEINIGSPSFARMLSWIISFYQEALYAIEDSSISDKNKSTASANIKSLFVPFIPPFPQTKVNSWYASSLSATNESYFDLLSDSLRREHAIYIPDEGEILSIKEKLNSLIVEMEGVGLPKWINDEYRSAIYLAILAVDKLPFLAHRVIQDSQNSILARLFNSVSPDHKRFMVRVATTLNLVLAAFVMPHEATDAMKTYYQWAVEAPVDQQQIDACAAPLALPPPTEQAS